MRKALLACPALALALLVLPPLYGALFSGPPPELPAPGRRVVLPSGAALNVLDVGAGPPLMLVHGLPGTAYDWREFTREAAKRGRRVLALDRAGYGRSDPEPSGMYHVDQGAQRLRDVIEALELEDLTLVGWSYGGVLSLVTAVRDTGALRSLVLVGTGGPDSPEAVRPEPPAFMRFLYSDPVLYWRTRVPSTGRALMRVLSVQAFSEQPMPGWWLPGLEANFARIETLHAYRAEIFDNRDEADYAPERVQLPTLLLHGTDDRLAPVGISRYLATQIPGARLVEFPGGSHMLPVTHAAELADALIDFDASLGE